MALYGVDLNITIKKIMMDLKLSLTKYGGINIKNLKKLFREFDLNGNGKLEKYEFERALAKFGFFPKTQDLTALQKFFDIDKDGSISYQEFMIALREPLNERRYKLISKVFNKFDVQKTGQVNLQSLCEAYDISKNLDFVNGKKSQKQLVGEFAASFDVEGSEQNLSFDNFLQYYEDLSLSIPSDSAFMFLVQNCWGIAEDDESNIGQEEIKSIVKNLRQKLIQITQGNHDEFILRKFFADFNVSSTGYMSIEELDAMLIKLDFPMQKKYLLSLFRKFDSNNSGYIEFTEFCEYILHNPYP